MVDDMLYVSVVEVAAWRVRGKNKDICVSKYICNHTNYETETDVMQLLANSFYRVFLSVLHWHLVENGSSASSAMSMVES